VSARGGHRASAPDDAWRPVERTDPAEPTLVRFVEERTGKQKVFDFSGFPVPEAMRRWLARVFARRVGPRSGIKRTVSAANFYVPLRVFADWLAETDEAISGPHQLTAGHLAAFRLRYAGAPGGAGQVIGLRSALRDDPELADAVRSALLARPPRKPDSIRPVAYNDHEWQLIMTALRSDVRRARDRIRNGRRLLADYRAGRLAPGAREVQLGVLLDVFDSTGHLPRRPDGSKAASVRRAGGVVAVTSMLCLTLGEMSAFCLLLCALSGENFSTVSAWPALHIQPRWSPR
jgi:hypothetical protein